MATANLPEYVTIVNSYDDSLNYGVIRLAMYNGVAKQKRTLLAPIRTVTMSLMIRGNDNKKLFDAWFKDELQGGTARFIYRDKTVNKSYLARFSVHPLTWEYSGPGQVWTTNTSIEFLVQ